MKKSFFAVIILFSAAVLFSSCGAALGERLFGSGALTSPDTDFTEPQYIDYTVSRMLYSGLEKDEQQAYCSVYNAVTRHETRIAVPKLSDDSFKTVYYALTRDNPHIICLEEEFTLVNSGGVLYFVPHYSENKEECDKKTAEMLSYARAVSKKASALQNEYACQLYLHDTLISECDYAVLASSNAYNALIKKESSCTGYALGLKLMLDISGIQSAAVKGVAADKHNSGNHLWLAVKTDGKWYHCDPTWDDPVGGTGLPEHSYFNVSTDSISVTHSGFTLPAGVVCESEEANYYIINGLFCTENDAEKIIYRAFFESLKDGSALIDVRFNSNALLHATLTGLEGGMLEEWIRNADTDGRRYNGFFCTNHVNEEMNILQMEIKIR